MACSGWVWITQLTSGRARKHLGVDIDLVVARPFAGNLVAFDVHRDDVVVGHLLDADAAGLHQELVGIAGQPRRDVAPDVIALALVDQDAAGMDHLRAQLVGHRLLPSFCCRASSICPRTVSISAPASAGSASARHATCPSGRTRTRRALVGRQHLFAGDGVNGQRHAAFLGCAFDIRGWRRRGAELQQHKAPAEQVERRLVLAEPDMRRTGAGSGGLNVGMREVRRCGRAVRRNDRRIVVAVPHHHAVGEPLLPHDRGEPVAVLLARGVAGRAGRENLRPGQPLARRQHPLEVAARLRDVAQPHRPPLGLVGGEQRRPAPALDRGFELPAEVDRVADAGVHAEAAGRRHQVRRVAGDENSVACRSGRRPVRGAPSASPKGSRSRNPSPIARFSAARMSSSPWLIFCGVPTIDMRKRSEPLTATMVSHTPSGPMKMKR